MASNGSSEESAHPPSSDIGSTVEDSEDADEEEPRPVLNLQADASPSVVDLAGSDENESEEDAGVTMLDEPNSTSDGPREDTDDHAPIIAATIPATNPSDLRNDNNDDDVVEVLEPRATKRRKRQRSNMNDQKETVVIKPQPTECTICYDPCTNAGRHRLVALKCGHLFGKRCIERWVLERKSCPNCNVAVRRTDIRVLFSDHAAVVDNSGIEDMTAKYEAEKQKRIQVETELSRAKLQLEIRTAEVKRHEEEALTWKREFMQLQCRISTERFAAEKDTSLEISPAGKSWSASQSQHTYPVAGYYAPVSASQPTTLRASASPSSSPWCYAKAFDYTLQNARVFDIASSCSMLCIGDTLSENTYGVLKLSTVDPRHSVRVSVHQQPVRDIKINVMEDLALTVAFDGKFGVTNLNACSVVMKCPFPTGKRQGWSCAWSTVDPFAMYCGFHDGTIAKYDMRKANGDPVETFALHEKQPVHSIKLFTGENGNEQLVAASFSGISLWKDCNSNSSSADTPDARADVASCCSLSAMQLKPSQVVVSSRTQSTVPAKHCIFDLTQDNGGSLVSAGFVTGHRTPPVLSRSAIWETPQGTVCIASGDEERHQVMIWNATTNDVVERLRQNVMVVDVQHSVAHKRWNYRKALFGVLQAKRLMLYSYKGE